MGWASPPQSQQHDVVRLVMGTAGHRTEDTATNHRGELKMPA